MTIKFTPNQIQRLRREATALKKVLGISHTAALDTVARQNHFANWALLMKNGTALRVPAGGRKKQPLTRETLLNICIQKIEQLDGAEVFALCMNGGLWIDRSDTLNNTVTVDSLHVLGSNSRNHGHSIGAILLTNFDGLADVFVLDTDEDDDGNPVIPQQEQILYSAEVGRKELLECMPRSMESDFDSLTDALAEIG